MKRVFLIVAGIVVVSVGYWLISPLFIDKRVSGEFPQNTSPMVYLSGSFVGFDQVHHGSGDVRVYKTTEGYVIRFEDNFTVANGPDLYVGLGRDGKYNGGAQLERLKGNQGSQNYLVPQTLNLDDYNEVWIWCRTFSVGFAKAELK